MGMSSWYFGATHVSNPKMFLKIILLRLVEKRKVHQISEYAQQQRRGFKGIVFFVFFGPCQKALTEI